MTAPRFIPPATPQGGTPFGNSYTSKFVTCPRDWFNEFYRPGIDEEGKPAKGLRPRTTKPFLLSGSEFHEMMAAWYASGCKDGEDTGQYSLDRAIDAGEEAHRRLISQYDSPEKAEEAWEDNERMMVAYHDRFGPGGLAQDYPDIQVVCDGNGEPLVERPWAYGLTDGYIYTCRTDLIIYKRGYLSTMEHKTCQANWVWQRRNSIPWDSQFTGEYWILKSLFPQETLNGVEVNIVIKKRSPNSKYQVAEREGTSRTDGQLERWRRSTIDALFSIDEAVNKFDRMMATGNFTLEESANLCFPDHGTRNGGCTAYSGCAYQDLCRFAGMEEKMMRGYTVKRVEEVVGLREWAGE